MNIIYLKMILEINSDTDCKLDNKTAIFFNFLKNTYIHNFTHIDNKEYVSIEFFIYSYMLSHIPSLSNVIQNNLTMEYPYKVFYELKKEYSFYVIDIPKYINEFIKAKKNNINFVNKISKLNNMKYKTNNKNTILFIMSSKEFNIGNIYNEYVKKLNNEKLQIQEDKKIIDTHNKNKYIVYDVFYILEGLYKIMFSNDGYTNLEEYENKTYNELLLYLKKKYGDVYLSYKDIDFIYNSYLTKQIKYYSIYTDIIKYPELMNHIVKLFILKNFNNYNSRLIDLTKSKQFKKFIDKYFNKFLEDGEEQSDDESNIPYNTNIENIKIIKNTVIKNLKNTELFKKVLNLIKIDYLKINTITEQKFDNLSVFIENIKNKTIILKNIPNNNQIIKPVTKPEKKESNISYSLISNLLNKIESSKDDDDDYIINDNSILSPVYKDPFHINIDGSDFKFESMIQYIYFNEYVLLYNIYTNNKTKSLLLSYNYLFKNTTTNIINVSDNMSDSFKDVNELETSLDNLFNEIKLYLFNISISYKKDNKYFNFIVHQLKDINIKFNNDDDYLGLNNNKGENLLGDFFESEHNLISRTKNCPDNFYISLEILCNFNKDIIKFIDYTIIEYCNYINIFCKYNNIYNIDYNNIYHMFKILSKNFIINENDIYITPYLSSFKIYINNTINSIKYNYNINETIHIDDKIIYQIWVHLNLMCNHFNEKMKINKNLNYSLLDNVINYVNIDSMNMNVNLISNVIENVEKILSKNLNNDYIISNQDKYTLILYFIQGYKSDNICYKINDVIKYVFNHKFFLNINNSSYKLIHYKLNILQKK